MMGRTVGGVRGGVYVISVVAELVGVHPQTLRNYERSGLLTPGRSEGGVRRFNEDDVTLVRRILELTAAGVNLEGVRRILALEAELDELRRQEASAPRSAEGHN
jgi:MerR family transcriptional regulator/heat shock protein HspR